MNLGVIPLFSKTPSSGDEFPVPESASFSDRQVTIRQVLAASNRFDGWFYITDSSEKGCFEFSHDTDKDRLNKLKEEITQLNLRYKDTPLEVAVVEHNEGSCRENCGASEKRRTGYYLRMPVLHTVFLLEYYIAKATSEVSLVSNPFGQDGDRQSLEAALMWAIVASPEEIIRWRDPVHQELQKAAKVAAGGSLPKPPPSSWTWKDVGKKIVTPFKQHSYALGGGSLALFGGLAAGIAGVAVTAIMSVAVGTTPWVPLGLTAASGFFGANLAISAMTMTALSWTLSFVVPLVVVGAAIGLAFVVAGLIHGSVNAWKDMTAAVHFPDHVGSSPLLPLFLTTSSISTPVKEESGGGLLEWLGSLLTSSSASSSEVAKDIRPVDSNPSSDVHI